jgi:hypothetical protein
MNNESYNSRAMLGLKMPQALKEESAACDTAASRELGPDALNISKTGWNLRVQIKTDSRHAPFVERAAPRQRLGLMLPVASLEDILLSHL